MTNRWRLSLVVALLAGLALALLVGGFDPLSAQSTAPAYTPNQELPLPLTAGSLPVTFVVRGLEPSISTDSQGSIYVSSIRGVPTGVDLHRYSPVTDGPANADGTLPFVYLGRPDNCGIFATGCDNLGVAEGGGDSSLAVTDLNPATGIPDLTVTSLTLAPGVTSMGSLDRGNSFSQPNPAAALIPGDDRQWTDGIDQNTVYLTYHDVATFNIEVQRSTDGGQTYVDGFGEAIDPSNFLIAGSVSPTGSANIAGPVKIDHSQCTSRGNVYSVYSATDNATENATGAPLRSMYVGVSTDARQNLPVYTFTDHKIATGPAGSSTAQIFPYLAVDNFGHLFAAWSDNSNILYASSSDQGTTWTAPVRVNQGATLGMANVFPTIAADANGHVAVAWFGADRAGNSNDAAVMEPCPTGNTTCMTLWANWNVYVAETLNGAAATPAFVQSVASDHVIHRGTISTGGLGGAANRNLGDFFQISFDPQHRLNLAFSDDHLLSPLDAAGTSPDDPSARRHIRAYYTRQTAPTAGIVTSGACAAAAPQPGNNISGSGQLGAQVKFGISAHDQPLNGALHYSDSGASLDVKSSNGVTSVAFSGNCATVSGNAKVNGNPGYTYTYNACDNGTPGAGQDTFNISVTGSGMSYSQGGTLTGGNLSRP